MNQDYLNELGSLALATRLKNLAERLARDVSRVYKESSIDFEPRWFTLIYALKDGEELAVTELSAMLHQTHPAVNQVVNILVDKGLVQERKDVADQRRRLLKLTAKGEEITQQMEPLWKRVKKANDELLSEIGGDFLSSLSQLESGLEKESMHQRIGKRQ